MRSKPDPVDQPERTAHYDCALLKCYTIQYRDSSVNIPLPPDQHHCSDEAKWRLAGASVASDLLFVCVCFKLYKCLL